MAGKLLIIVFTNQKGAVGETSIVPTLLSLIFCRRGRFIFL